MRVEPWHKPFNRLFLLSLLIPAVAGITAFKPPPDCPPLSSRLTDKFKGLDDLPIAGCLNSEGPPNQQVYYFDPDIDYNIDAADFNHQLIKKTLTDIRQTGPYKFNNYGNIVRFNVALRDPDDISQETLLFLPFTDFNRLIRYSVTDMSQVMALTANYYSPLMSDSLIAISDKVEAEHLNLEIDKQLFPGAGKELFVNIRDKIEAMVRELAIEYFNKPVYPINSGITLEIKEYYVNIFGRAFEARKFGIPYDRFREVMLDTQFSIFRQHPELFPTEEQYDNLPVLLDAVTIPSEDY